MSWRDRAKVVEAPEGSSWRDRANPVESPADDSPAWQPPEWDLDGPPQPKIGAGETFFSRAADAIPLGRPVTSALAALGAQVAKAGGVGQPSAKLGPAALQAMQGMGIDYQAPQNAIGEPLDEYRRIRDMRDERGDIGAQQNPRAALGGMATGTLASALVPAGSATKGLGATLKMGAGMGALQAAGDSRADLTRGEVGQQLLDTALGAAVGAPFGVAGHVGGRLAAKASAPLMSRAAALLERFGLNQGRRALLAGADSISGRLPVSDDAVRAAHEVGAIRPLASTEEVYRTLVDARNTAGTAYGALLDELEALGVKGPVRDDMAVELVRRGLEKAQKSMQPSEYMEFSRKAQELLSKGTDDSGRLGLRDAEALKSSLQREAVYDRQTSKPVNDVRKEIASYVREQNERAVKEAGESLEATPRLMELADDFVPQKRRVGNLIEATNASERGHAAASRRSATGLKDTILSAPLGPVFGPPVALGTSIIRGRMPSTMSSASLASSKQLRRALMPGGPLEDFISASTRAGGLAAGEQAALGEDEPSRYELLMRALSDR